MGRTARERPRRLGAKLLQIRQALDLTQAQMLVTLKLDKKVFASAISGYELGTREPTLPVLLRYARLVGVSTDVLIDDDLVLPNKMFRDARKQRSGG
jgi:transcriptional regulator with XRE-family HTH domain